MRMISFVGAHVLPATAGLATQAFEVLAKGAPAWTRQKQPSRISAYQRCALYDASAVARPGGLTARFKQLRFCSPRLCGGRAIRTAGSQQREVGDSQNGIPLTRDEEGEPETTPTAIHVYAYHSAAAPHGPVPLSTNVKAPCTHARSSHAVLLRRGWRRWRDCIAMAGRHPPQE
jgi:hypothetical protein